MESLIEDIRKNGIKESIKYVVAGHHRLAIAKFLSLNKVPVTQVNLSYKGFNKPADLRS